MSDQPVTLSPDELRARSRRNVAIAVALTAFVVLVFAVTIVRLKEQVVSPWFDTARGVERVETEPGS